MNRHFESGLIHPLVVVSIVLGVLTVGLGVFGIWSYVNYQDHKNNVDAKVEIAVAEAKEVQRDEDEALFAEREKQPTRELVGPSDLGRVSFSYPKTWSVYVDKSDSDQYQAYLHPGVVPPLGSDTPYALRISVLNRDYDDELRSYENDIEEGELTAKPVIVQGETGTRLDGRLSRDRQGAMVIFKVRDKTLRVFTENRKFLNDFEKIILKTLDFNT